MRLYGKCGKGDPCYDRKHCDASRGSRTREKRRAMEFEKAADAGERKRRTQAALGRAG